MAFIGDDKVEIAGGIFGVFADHGLQGGDDDAAGDVGGAIGAQHVAGYVRQMFGERVLGLFGQGDAIDQEQSAAGPAALEQALDEGGGGAGFAGSGGHFDQHLAAALGDFAA